MYVAIDPKGRWLASVGKRLQLWDLTLEVPPAFPINTRSALEELAPRDLLGRDDLFLQFGGNGSWLVVYGKVEIFGFAEFWDLRFDDNFQRAGTLARRNF